MSGKLATVSQYLEALVPAIQQTHKTLHTIAGPKAIDKLMELETAEVEEGTPKVLARMLAVVEELRVDYRKISKACEQQQTEFEHDIYRLTQARNIIMSAYQEAVQQVEVRPEAEMESEEDAVHAVGMQGS